jgi:hypothetical protein
MLGLAARARPPTPEPELEQEFENDDGLDSRKRPRSEDQEEGQIDEQDDMDYQNELEASETGVRDLGSSARRMKRRGAIRRSDGNTYCENSRIDKRKSRHAMSPN